MPTRTTPNAIATTNDRDAALDAIAQRELIIAGLFAGDQVALPDTYACATENLRAALQAAFAAGARASRRPANPVAVPVVGDLVLTSPKPTDGSATRAKGRIGAFRFDAKVYPAHAACASYEIARSRISKLELRRLDSDTIAYAWDRGLDIPAMDAATQAAVDTVTAHLADHLYGPATR